MRNVVLTAILALAIFLALAVQDFLPPIAYANGARVLLVPVFFCFGACVLPFPCMLILAIEAGFLCDFSTLQIVQRLVPTHDPDVVQAVGTVEMSPGWSILLFVVFGAICQGFRPMVLEGHWWLPPLLSCATVIAYLATQFVMISMRRFDDGGLVWTEAVAWRILAPGVVAMILTLVLMIVALLTPGAGWTERKFSRDF